MSNAKHAVSRNQITASLLSSIFEMLSRVDAEDTAGLMDEWRQYDGYIGKSACLISQKKTIEGVIEGVDDQGALLMAIGGSVKSFSSGELSLRLRQ